MLRTIKFPKAAAVVTLVDKIFDVLGKLLGGDNVAAKAMEYMISLLSK